MQRINRTIARAWAMGIVLASVMGFAGGVAAAGASPSFIAKAPAQFAQRKATPPRITKILRHRLGYYIYGTGFGTSRSAIAVYQNDKRLPPGNIARVRDTLIDVRALPSGTARIRVARGAMRTNVLTYRFPASSGGAAKQGKPGTGTSTAGRGPIALSPAQKLLLAKTSARDMKRGGKSASEAARAQKDSYGASPQQALKNLIDGGYPLEAALDAVKRIFKRPDEFTISLLKAVGAGVHKATRAAVTTFKDKTAAWLLENLARTGYDPKDLSFDLKGLKGLTAHVAAATMKKLGAKGEQVMAVLKDVYRQSASGAANIMKNVGYRIEAVADALKRIFNVPAVTAMGIFKSVFNASAPVATRAATAAGWLHDKIGEALKRVYNLGASAAAAVMKAAGWTADKALAVLNGVYNLAAPAAAPIMKAAGWGANQVARALHSVLGASDRIIAIALKAAGWDAPTVSNAFKSLGKSAKSAARAMKQAGFGPRAIASAIKAKYRQSAAQVARIMSEIGYSFNAIKDAIIHAFQMGAASVLALLAQLGIR